jgi:ribosome biogenesis protein NSA1
MHNNPAQQNLVATGGKENDLKLWSLDGTTKPLFTAKNV